MTAPFENALTQEYFLKPGYIYLPEKSTVISTVLGSSVSVGIYDKKMRVGGMNHFRFPSIQSKNTGTALYGNIAIPALIRMMIKNGSKLKRLEAQIFGGAHNQDVSNQDIGRANYRIARQILKRINVKVVSEDVGGSMGRKVIFNTSNYEVGILKVDRLRDSDWYPYDGTR